LLVRTHNPDSDIDLVFYDENDFHRARQILAALTGRGKMQALDQADWRAAYDRRGCSLSFAEYLWHERRKSNKALFEGTKFDLGLVLPGASDGDAVWSKGGEIRTRAAVIDDTAAFAYPSRLLVRHPLVTEVVSFTATYTGQARTGEWIEVAGHLEESSTGDKRIIVGTSREAAGEYVKVLQSTENVGV
jgi:hypothetical protein